jgi:hypothetical protein
MDFTFDYDSTKEPFSFTIEVEYSIFTFDGNYYEPSECNISELKYIIKCGSIDMTDFITETLYDTPLSNEVIGAIEDAVWEHYEKN